MFYVTQMQIIIFTSTYEENPQNIATILTKLLELHVTLSVECQMGQNPMIMEFHN